MKTNLLFFPVVFTCLVKDTFLVISFLLQLPGAYRINGQAQHIPDGIRFRLVSFHKCIYRTFKFKKKMCFMATYFDVHIVLT
jgi:hypothetical protein